MASFKVNVSQIRKLAASLGDAQLRTEINDIASSKETYALISHAIQDNFDKEGPGWAPLKAETIRRSAGAKHKKKAEKLVLQRMGLSSKSKIPYGQKTKFNEKVAKLMQKADNAARAGGEPLRMILQKTGLLKKSVTTPGVSSAKGVTGTNIFIVANGVITWGTDLSYAKAHQEGDSKKSIPARPFLVIREDWRRKLDEYVLERIRDMIQKRLNKAGV